MRSRILLALWLALAGQSVGWAGQLKTHPALPEIGSDPSALCGAAVVTAEIALGLPARLLQAISLTESGRTDPVSGDFRAWPWSINAEGQGQFFATRQAAVAAAKGLLARGVRSIDVGCLQVNLMFHPNAFNSLNEAFDPVANARYAARFLNQLYAEGRDWPRAVASYHSDTPALGDAYRAMVMARWRNDDHQAALRTEAAGASAYRDFARDDRSYRAFAPRSLVYRAFAPR